MFGRNFGQRKCKYNNTKVEIDGITFDSKKESQRYLILKDALQRGEISDLECHKTYELIPSQKIKVTETKQLKTKVKVIEKEKTLFMAVHFSPDFVYKNKDGKIIVEDVKGSKSKLSMSADFPLRQKMLYAKYGLYVNIVTKATAPIGVSEV